MRVEELLEEAEKQREAEYNARKKAEECELLAIQTFLEEHELQGLVAHKETGKKGFLEITKDRHSFKLDFYPAKKNGEKSQVRDVVLGMNTSFGGISKTLEKVLEGYEPA